MHWSRVLLLAAALLSLVALPLAFLQSDATGAVNGISGDAWPATVALGAVGALALLGDRAEGFGAARVLAALLLAGFAVVFAAVKVADAARAADAADGSIGIGVWVLAAAALVGVGGALASASRKIG